MKKTKPKCEPHSPEYLALKRIADLNEGDLAKYCRAVDEIAVDACIAYEHRHEGLEQSDTDKPLGK